MGGLDVLNGGAGFDTIIGGANGDLMTGGANADTFVFNSVEDMGDGSISSLDCDLITDFDGGQDRIDLSGIDANSIVAGDQAFSVVESFTGSAGELMIIMGLFNGIERPAIVVDVDGNGVEDGFFFIDATDGTLPLITDLIL